MTVRDPRSFPEWALGDLERRFSGIDGVEAMATLRRRFADPATVRPMMSAGEALLRLQRESARYATMLQLAREA